MGAGETEAIAALPRAVTVFTVVLALVGTALGAASVALFGAGDPRWWLAGPFTALLVAAGYLIIRFQYRDEVEALDLFEAVLAPVLFAFPGFLVVALVAAAKLFAGALHRNRSIKAAFNVAQWMTAAGVGSLVYGSLREGTRLDLHNVGALVSALVALSLVNHLAFATVISLSQRRPIAHVLAGFRPVIVPGWLIGGAVNVTFGLLFVAAYEWSAAAVGLFFAPLFALSWAYGAYGAARADVARVSALHRASVALAGPLDPSEAIPRFLSEVRECFESEAVDLVLVRGEGRTVHRLRTGRPISYATHVEAGDQPTLAAALLDARQPVRVTAAHSNLAVAALLRREGWRDCLAAPLVVHHEVVGLLCTYNRTGLEGFEEGEVAVLRALADDVVEAIRRGQLVEEVLEERRKLGEIVNNTSDGILTLAPDGTITSWNPALEIITGYPAEEMVGTGRFGTLRPRDPQGHDVMVEQWAAGEVSLPAELQVLSRTGDVRWLSCSHTTVAGGEGAPGSLIVVARDVTKAHDLERLKEDFVATVSHELRTPIAPIKGWATTLLEFGDRLSPDQRREAMESILRQAQRLERLVVNLLEASKIEHGRIDKIDGDVDVVPVVTRVIDEFQAAWPARVFLLDGTDGPCHAVGNELWVEQILSNLVSNAIKYSPGSEPVAVSVVERSGEVEIAVTDSGPGIPAHERDRIFERFHRIDQNETQSGTGLGLYIARQLAAEIGATVTVSGAPEGGSRFSLHLRRAGRLIAVS